MPGLANDENDGEINELRFFFVHLMKTGGTSFALPPRKQFQPRAVYPSAGYVSPARPAPRSDETFTSAAKVIRPLTAHRSARIGANAVVDTDRLGCTTLDGAPVRPVRDAATC
jgi:hypothetical protein